MKKEEAIRILNEQAYLFYEDTYPYERIAYDMAIKSLSAEPSEKPITKEMKSVILRLKSGREFRFECTEYSIQTLKNSGSLCGFNYKGGVGECPIWFDINDIEVIAIVSKGSDPA